jgi:hypothetical protein
MTTNPQLRAERRKSPDYQLRIARRKTRSHARSEATIKFLGIAFRTPEACVTDPARIKLSLIFETTYLNGLDVKVTKRYAYEPTLPKSDAPDSYKDTYNPDARYDPLHGRGDRFYPVDAKSLETANVAGQSHYHQATEYFLQNPVVNRNHFPAQKNALRLGFNFPKVPVYQRPEALGLIPKA